jgi:hypothetical protein
VDNNILGNDPEGPANGPATRDWTPGRINAGSVTTESMEILAARKQPDVRLAGQNTKDATNDQIQRAPCFTVGVTMSGTIEGDFKQRCNDTLTFISAFAYIRTKDGEVSKFPAYTIPADAECDSPTLHYKPDGFSSTPTNGVDAKSCAKDDPKAVAHWDQLNKTQVAPCGAPPQPPRAIAVAAGTLDIDYVKDACADSKTAVA